MNRFSEGASVRVASLEYLVRFAIEWREHNPLQKEQLQYADQVSRIERLVRHDNGDLLLRLGGIPGLWHPCCMELTDDE